MAKLYWRVKIDGKWTWKPARVTYHNVDAVHIEVAHFQKEESP